MRINKVDVIIMTARVEKYRDDTMKWLYKYGINIDSSKLLMRPMDNLDDSVTLKRKMINQLVFKKCILALDDREDICKMYKEEYGIPTIVNTMQGTSMIKTGQRIRMDAKDGAVYILDK